MKALDTLKDLETDRCLVQGFYDAVKDPTAAEDELLAAAPPDEEALKTNWGIPDFIAGLTGLPLARKLLYQPTCTICGLTSGYGGPGTKTVLPRVARAKIDCRLVPEQRATDIAAKIRAHLDRHGFGDVELELLSAENPSQSPVDGQLARAAIATARDTYGDVRVLPRNAGTGPMFLFREELGLPCVSGFGCGNVGSRVHAPDENVFVDDYFACVQHVVRLLGALGG